MLEKSEKNNEKLSNEMERVQKQNKDMSAKLDFVIKSLTEVTGQVGGRHSRTKR